MNTLRIISFRKLWNYWLKDCFWDARPKNKNYNTFHSKYRDFRKLINNSKDIHVNVFKLCILTDFEVVFLVICILVPRALLTRGATRDSGQTITGYHKNMVRKQYPVLELANQIPVRIWIWPEPLVAPRVRRPLGTRTSDLVHFLIWELFNTRRQSTRHLRNG
jgi:hypothetical protein